MSAKIIISPELALPIDIVTLRTAIYGTSGAGKTTFARLLAERVHAATQRFCAIDLKNDWWGLKSSADGKSEGLPIVIFGGPKRDVQIFDDAGAATADTVASIEQSCIIDLDDFSRNKQLKFLTAFLERLYDVNRKPLMLFADESDRYAPQKPMSDQMNFSLGASEDICRRGRKRGIGSLWLTQRTAVLNKNVSDICDLTVVFRTPGARDLKDLEERVARVASKEQVAEVMRQAPGLEDGQAIFLSSHPKLRGFMPEGARPMQLPLPWTFDSSATPAVGQRKREPKVLAKTDLAEIEQRMAAQVERAKADDPKELRKKVAELQRELEKSNTLIKTAPPKKERIEVPALKDGQLTRLEKWLIDWDKTWERSVNSINRVVGQLKQIGEVREALSRVRDSKQSPVSGQNLRAPGSQLASSTSSPAGTVPRSARPIPERSPAGSATSPGSVNNPRPTPAGGDNGEISGVSQRILDALAELEQLGARTPDRALVAFMAGYSNLSSKGFANGIGALRTGGYIDYPERGVIALTESGRGAANYGVAPSTPADVQRRICQMLGGASSRVLEPLIAAYPSAMARTELAEAAGYGNLSSKGFANAIGRLRSLGFIDYPDRGTVKAKPVLFLETA